MIQLHNVDSLVWLKDQKPFKAIITSLPDKEEVGMSELGWVQWLHHACELLAEKVDENGIIFFYQMNRRINGRLIDKNFLISRVFIGAGYNKIIEKVCLKQKVGTINPFRPTYTNLFAFSKSIRAGKSTADVIFAGQMLYKNAMGSNAIQYCLDFIRTNVKTNTILDPFCGQGSILLGAKSKFFEGIGVDIDPEQIEIAKNNLGQ